MKIAGDANAAVLLASNRGTFMKVSLFVISPRRPIWVLSGRAAAMRLVEAQAIRRYNRRNLTARVNPARFNFQGLSSLFRAPLAFHIRRADRP